MSGKQRQTFLNTMASGISEIAREGIMADIQIEVDGKEYPCHRIILASQSPYFRAMFSSGMMETRTNTMKINDVEQKTFECFLDYAYNGKITVTADNVQELLRCAAIFQIPPLQEHCETMLADDIDTENCLTMFKISRLFNCKMLFEKCRPFVMEGFNGLWKTEEFNTLDFDDLQSIVRDDDLVPVDEEQICEAVLQWVDADTDERRIHISKLFRYVRLVNISPEYLIEELYRNEILTSDPDCMQYLDEARNFHMLPARQQEFGTPRFHLRNSEEFEEVVLVLTEFDMERSGSFYQDGKCLWAYSLQQNRWFTLAPIPHQHNPGLEFAIVTYRNDIYLSGGDITSKVILKYDSERNEWAPCEATMKRGRYFHMMGAVRESVYVMGGYNLKVSSNKHVQGSIEEYSIRGRRWAAMGDLAVPVHGASTAVIGEQIFIFGGKQEDDTYFDSVQVFDTRRREANIACKLPDGIEQPLNILTINYSTYIFTKKGVILEFQVKPDIKFKPFKKLPQGCLPVLGCAHYRGNVILLCANSDKPEQFAKMFKLDLKQTPVKVEPVTPKNNIRPKPIHACCRGVVNKQFMYHTYFQ